MLGRRMMTSAMGGAGILIPGYAVNAVEFDGTNDWLERDADLTGNANGKKGIISVWFKMGAGTDGADHMFYEAIVGSDLNFQFFRDSGNKFSMIGKGTSNIIRLDLETSGTYTVSSGWTHFLASWDLAVAGSGRLYMDDVDDKNEVTYLNNNLDYTIAEHGIGARPDGSFLHDG